MIMDFRDNMRKCEVYIRALEDERVKIQVFQRELPLCLELVTQAIEAYKQQLSSNNGENNTNNGEDDQCVNGNSECSEQEASTGNHGPVLEVFIPLKSCNSSQDHHHIDQLQCNKEDISMDQNDNYDYEINVYDNISVEKKSDWLRSVQLWNQTPDPYNIQEENGPKRSPKMDLKKNGGGAFQPFEKEKATTTCNNNNTNVNNNNNKTTSATTASSSSSAEAATPRINGGSGGKKEDKGGPRKARRCWSTELHKRFLHALHQLGGSHVATPKQIRELMKVDGLTNDEVKSHLQKYRLHTTRRPSSTTNQATASPPAPPFVVVGGIWMPPPEYTAMATPTPMTTTTHMSTSNGLYYAPLATMAPTPIPCSQQQQQFNSPLYCEERGCQSDGGVHSNSTSTSSTHTT